MTERALDAIRLAATDGSLIIHKDLLFILHYWQDFSGSDTNEVRAWANELMTDTNAIIALARGMLGETRSMGMGGFGSLGDRVSKTTRTVKIEKDTDLIDFPKFLGVLELIRDEGKIEPESLDVVQTFLDAWDRKCRGDTD